MVYAAAIFMMIRVQKRRSAPAVRSAAAFIRSVYHKMISVFKRLRPKAAGSGFSQAAAS